MVCVQYIVSLFLATAVLADYYIDNANTSVTYSMAPSVSGQAWQTFSTTTQELQLQISNSTGNFTITLDASHCYDQNYALGVCGTGDNCYVQIPFVGSGIAMYVFNAGFSGMTASFSVDGRPSTTNSIDAPPAPTYQVSNVSLYNIQGLVSGNHTMVMTILDWTGSTPASATSMKFDYAYVNETYIAPPATTTSASITSTSASLTSSQSQTPSQTSTSNKSSSNHVATVVGATVGGVIGVAVVLIALFFWRRRRGAQAQGQATPSPHQVNPFMSEYQDSTAPQSAPLLAPQRPFYAQHPPDVDASVPPHQRSAILLDAFAAGSYPTSELIGSPRSTGSGTSLHGQRSVDDMDRDMSSVSRLADAGSPFSDIQFMAYDLTPDQLAIVDRLRAERVPAPAIAQVINGMLASGGSGGRAVPEPSLMSRAPPSYQTRDR